MNKIKIYTLGCKVNQHDSRELKNKMIKAGFDFVSEKADLAIINTCAVTKQAIQKSKKMINKAKKENPKARIILTGCWPKIYAEQINCSDIDLIINTRNWNTFLKKINEKFCSNILFAPKKNSHSPLNKERSRYFIKIQDGCEQFCSYCIIPYARGKMKSRKEKEIIREIENALKQGYQEIILSGIHLGLYGQEKSLKTKNNLTKLLKKLIKIKQLKRIRLSSIEVSEISDELIELVKKSKKICKHLHIPLQSGSDKILKLMNRPYNINYYKNKIKKIREAVPKIALTTDIIVGFPGEEEEKFEKTFDFVKKIKYSRLHVFPFSAHEKTPASKLKNKIKREIILKRSARLRKLGKILEKQYKNKFIGKELDIMIEKIFKDKIKGKTEYYFDVEIPKKKLKANQIKKVAGKIIKIRL